MRINNIIPIIALVAMFFVGTEARAQKKVVETSFNVSGICGMCKDRIEKAVDVKGVKIADYDVESQTLTIAYSPKKITLDEIHALINDVGHDTDKSIATDEQYSRVHDCCKYREDAKH